jgi:hypothetical protein
VLLQKREIVGGVLHRQAHGESRDHALLHLNLLPQVADDLAAGLDRHLLYVAPLDFLLVLSVGNLGRGLGSLSRKLDNRDGHEDDENPERELLGALAPISGLFRRILVRHW